MLYVAGPIGTFAILIIRSADDATELTASWVSLIGAFKFNGSIHILPYGGC